EIITVRVGSKVEVDRRVHLRDSDSDKMDNDDDSSDEDTVVPEPDVVVPDAKMPPPPRKDGAAAAETNQPLGKKVVPRAKQFPRPPYPSESDKAETRANRRSKILAHQAGILKISVNEYIEMLGGNDPPEVEEESSKPQLQLDLNDEDAYDEDPQFSQMHAF
ncbi:MAG: hypothetical protein SGILL_007187, partial [Bacillariaceae sp.]